MERGNHPVLSGVMSAADPGPPVAVLRSGRSRSASAI